LFSTISDVHADYVSSPVSDDDLMLEMFTADYRTYKYCVLGLVVDEDAKGKPYARINYLPASGWFPQDGINHIARTYRAYQ